MRTPTLFLLLFILVVGCTEEEVKPINNGPEINIVSPTSDFIPPIGSAVEINANITDENEVHDVTINITNDYTDTSEIEIFFDHIHNTTFGVDTSFITDIPSGSMANYTIQISAEDMLGNSNSKSVTIHVMD